MSRHSLLYAGAAIVLIAAVGVVWSFVSAVMWLNDRPRWEMSVENTATGLKIEVYQEDESLPTYSTVLKNHQTPEDLDRVSIDDFPNDIGKTTFSDQSIKPGRWTVVIDGVELDIMPSRMVIDGTQEIAPIR